MRAGKKTSLLFPHKIIVVQMRYCGEQFFRWVGEKSKHARLSLSFFMKSWIHQLIIAFHNSLLFVMYSVREIPPSKLTDIFNAIHFSPLNKNSSRCHHNRFETCSELAMQTLIYLLIHYIFTAQTENEKQKRNYSETFD